MAALSNSLIDTWASDPDVTKWANRRKFGPSTRMTDQELRALARLHGGKPTGLYLWEGINHEIYIGISNESVTKRLRKHVKDYGFANIQSFRFRAHPGDREELRKIERELIHSALEQGFRVFNREHSAIIYGSSVFDELASPELQADWFKNPVRTNALVESSRNAVSDAEFVKSTKAFQQFMSLDEATEIVDALALYLRACTPFPFTTEAQYWSMTCLPSWSKNRVVTLNMGFLEMLYVHRTGKKDSVELYVGSDYTFLPRWRSWMKIRKLGVRRCGPLHATGLPNEEVLRFKTTDSFLQVMTNSPEVRLAIARFALDRMRKGRVSGRFRDAHNFLLAGEALERTNYWTPRRFRARSTF